MPAHRSIMELLPVPFEDVRAEHLRKLLGDGPPGDEESIFVEVKQAVDGTSLAKSCSAFANTLGGLLIVGVTKAGDFVGFDCPSVEAQVWVKDILRPHVIPMPPFRARFVPLEVGAVPSTGTAGPATNGPKLLLVLVEYSSTTPHIVARKSTIMVRRPGSSEPLPLEDQTTLFDLARRGEQARERAVVLARRRAKEPWAGAHRGHALALVPTGVPANWVDEALTPAAVSDLYQLVRSAVWREAEGRCPPRWEANRVSAELAARGLRGGVFSGSATLAADGSLLMRYTEEDVPIRGSLMLTDVLLALERMYLFGRAFLSGLGAHGDVRLAFRADYSDQEVILTTRGYFKDRDAPDLGQHLQAEKPLRAIVEEWGYLAGSEDLMLEDDQPLIRMGAAIERSLGAQPG